MDAGYLIIPNKDVTGSRLYNYSLVDSGLLRLRVGVAADTDVARARDLLIDLARHEPRVGSSPPPAVTVSAVADASITLELVVGLPDVGDLRVVRSALLERAVAAFRAHGLRLMEPHAPPEADRGPW